ncbi:ATP-binding protein [Streptomyces sp. NPDC057638]|uniref:ATP-binding protein n=1 Tax=Streptomyces sp. NPDC057638 TaxID=3346190 RepID=UPI00368F136E
MTTHVAGAADVSVPCDEGRRGRESGGEQPLGSSPALGSSRALGSAPALGSSVPLGASLVGGGPPWAAGREVPPGGFAACGLDGRLRNAPQARRFVTLTLRKWALESLVPDATLVVSELVTNAVQHALVPGVPRPGDYPVWLGLFRHPADIVCAVTDPSSSPPRPRDADDGALGGRGLALIGALSQTWSWSLTPPRGKTVWATLPLHPSVN